MGDTHLELIDRQQPIEELNTELDTQLSQIRVDIVPEEQDTAFRGFLESTPATSELKDPEAKKALERLKESDPKLADRLELLLPMAQKQDSEALKELAGLLQQKHPLFIRNSILGVAWSTQNDRNTLTVVASLLKNYNEEKLLPVLKRSLAEAMEDFKKTDNPYEVDALVKMYLQIGNDTSEKVLVDWLKDYRKDYNNSLFGSIERETDFVALELATALTNSNNTAQIELAFSVLCEKGASISAGHQALSNAIKNIGEDKVSKILENLFSSDTLKWKDSLDKKVTLKDNFQGIKLGIQYPERLEADVLKEVIKNRLENKPDKRPLAIFVMTREDKQEAFTRDGRFVKQFIDKGYRVMYFEAGSDLEFENALTEGTQSGKKAEQKASILFLGAHGQQKAMAFGKFSEANGRGTFDTGDLDRIRKTKPDLGNILKKDGQIVLMSCSTGQGREREDNMANMMRKLFPQARKEGIFSPEYVSEGKEKILFNKDGSIKEVDYGNSTVEEGFEGRLKRREKVIKNPAYQAALDREQKDQIV